MTADGKVVFGIVQNGLLVTIRQRCSMVKTCRFINQRDAATTTCERGHRQKLRAADRLSASRSHDTGKPESLLSRRSLMAWHVTERGSHSRRLSVRDAGVHWLGAHGEHASMVSAGHCA